MAAEAPEPRRLGGVRADHGEGLDREERLEEGLRQGVGAAAHGKYGDAYDQVAMAWLWSKIHLRFASRKGGPMQKEQLGYLMGSFAVLHRRAGAPPARRRRRRAHGPSVRAHHGRGRPRGGVVLRRRRASTPAMPSWPRCRRLLFKKMAPPMSRTTTAASTRSAGRSRSAWC